MTEIFPLAPFSDVLLITPKRYGDDRGFFAEAYHFDRYKLAGISEVFVQDNHSYSAQKGTLRGLHFQTPPHAQAKLVSCPRGRLLDVVVDILTGSPTYGRHVTVELSPQTGQRLFVLAGFAHGFCTLEDDTEIVYKVSDYYATDCDAGIAFDDSALAIDWPAFENDWIMSDKDKRLPRLGDINSGFSAGTF